MEIDFADMIKIKLNNDEIISLLQGRKLRLDIDSQSIVIQHSFDCDDDEEECDE